MLESTRRILEAPDVSYWLKDAIRVLLVRDCVDALKDAELLFITMKNECHAVLGYWETR